MKKVLFLFLLLVGMTNVYGQKFAVKSNLLYDATATINLGVEMELSKKWTLDLSGNYNGWKFGDDMRWKHQCCRLFSDNGPVSPAYRRFRQLDRKHSL